MSKTIEIYYECRDMRRVQYTGPEGQERTERLIKEVRRLNRAAIEGGWQSPYCWRFWEDEYKPEWGRSFPVERRFQVQGVVTCPKCGESMDLEADTDSWTLRRGLMEHEYYGPPMGQCCGLLVVAGFEGADVYNINKTEAS